MVWIARVLIAAAPALAQWFYTPVVCASGRCRLSSASRCSSASPSCWYSCHGLGADEPPYGRLATAVACRLLTISAGLSGSPDGGHGPRCAASGHVSGRRGRGE